MLLIYIKVNPSPPPLSLFRPLVSRNCQPAATLLGQNFVLAEDAPGQSVLDELKRALERAELDDDDIPAKRPPSLNPDIERLSGERSRDKRSLDLLQVWDFLTEPRGKG